MNTLITLLSTGVAPLAAAALLAAVRPGLAAVTARVAWWRVCRRARPAEDRADLHGAWALAEINAWERPELERERVQRRHIRTLVVAR